MIQALAFLANPAFWSGVGQVATAGANVYSATKSGGATFSVPERQISAPSGPSGLLKNIPIIGNILGNKAAKKARSLANQANVSSQHAINYYNDALINPNYKYWQQGWINEGDIDAMTDIVNNAISSINANPEFGVGQSYTSRYINESFTTAPSSAIAPAVDKYIEEKIKRQNEIGANMSEMIQIPDRQTQALQDISSLFRDFSKTALNTYYDIQAIKAQGRPAEYKVANPESQTGGINVWAIVALLIILFLILRRSK